MKRLRAFTLLETVLAIALLGLLAGALYAVSNAALDATRLALEEDANQERLDAFLRASRNAFASVPANGEVLLRFERGAGGAAAPELVFRGTGFYFGMPGLGGGEIVLAAPAMADGTRAFSLLRIPPGLAGPELDRWRNPSNWIRLLSRVEKVEWEFFRDGQWRAEWPEGSGRPQLVRLRFLRRDVPDDPVEIVFWLPPIQSGGGPPPTPPVQP